MGRVVKAAKHIFSKIMPPGLFLAALLTTNFAAAQPLTCSHVLSSQAVISSDVQTKIDQTIQNLSVLKLDLDQALAQGENAVVVRALSLEYNKKMTSLVEYLEKDNVMTLEQLNARMIQEIRKLQLKNDRNKNEEYLHRKVQEKQIQTFKIDGTKLIPHRVEPGSFKMGAIGNQTDVTITKPFEMMAIPTTQIVWKKVAILANQIPSQFSWIFRKNKYQMNVDPSHFKDETHPVESVSYEDVQVWIKALNELSAAGEPTLAEIILGHKKGDIYRLPTEAEWEFVIRGRGQYSDTYHFGDNMFSLDDYSWHYGNSGMQTHPVAQKLPLVINDKEFHDMYGSVYEWVQDWYQYERSGGIDPKGPKQGSDHILRGNGYNTLTSFVSSSQRSRLSPRTKQDDIGFRLVREAK